MTDTTDIEALVARGRSTFEGVPRNGLAYEMADALERQQAVVVAARAYVEIPIPWSAKSGKAYVALNKALTALDDPLEGKGK